LLLSFIIIPVIYGFFFFYDKEKRRVFYVVIIAFFWRKFIKLMERVGLISLVYNGRNKLEKLSGTIVVANHPSLIDVVILVSSIPKAVCVVKSSISTKNFFMKRVVNSAYIINNNDFDVFSQDIKTALDDGFNIVIFPEGSRTIDGEKSKLYKGAARVALMFNANILPIHINQSIHFLRKNQQWYNVGEEIAYYYITVKETVDIKDYQVEEDTDSKKTKLLMDKIRKELEL